MTDRPILFSAPMVLALLSGAKSQTRRGVKPQPAPHETWDWSWPVLRPGVTPGTRICWRDDVRRPNLYPYCPYGVPGDRLIVRETFRLPAEYDDKKPSLVRTDAPVWYQADPGRPEGWGKTRVSIHMPRWASRLILEITDVRVERLNDISAADADAEGFGGDYPDRLMPDVFPHREDGWGHLSIPECYAKLWEHINGPGSWAANPWVWVVSFERVDA